MQKHAIVLNPHDDDGIIAIGGTILQLLAKGWEIKYIQMTDGRHGSSSLSPEETILIREEETLKELESLKICDYINFEIEDGALNKLSAEQENKLVRDVTKEIVDYKPAAIFIPAESEGHPDHKATYAIGHTAYLQSKLPHLCEARYVVWQFPFKENVTSYFEKILLVDITPQLKRKKDLIKLHASQEAEVSGGYSSIAEHANRLLARQYFNYPPNKEVDAAEIIAITHFNAGAKLLEDTLKCHDFTRLHHGRKSENIEA